MHRRNIQPVAHHDTAGAARWVSETGDPEAAAVASARAAEVYGLAVLAESIEDNRTNRTRFLIVGREPVEPGGEPGKTSLVFSTAHRPGALHSALGCFATRGVNLLKLESRPYRTQGWEYVFYVDCEGWALDEPLCRTLAELQQETAWVKVLGSYPRAALQSA